MNEVMAERAHDLEHRLHAVQTQITAAAARAGRPAGDVTLIAVSKTVAPERVRLAIDAGVTDFGENRVQEAEGKIEALGSGIRWHLIGHLQRNKVNRALDLFGLIHSVDSVELATAIGTRATQRGTPSRVLLQVNVAATPTQFGFAEADLLAQSSRIAGIDGLALDGLMCIAPEVDHPEDTRPYFHRLARLHAELAPTMRLAGHSWRHLSMGMTNDFAVAVEEGATLVRVGRAIFGERPPNVSGAER